MITKFLKALESVPDPRRGAGKRHSIGTVLVISIMSVISGYTGYRAIGDFISSNKEELIHHLSLAKKRLPCYSTVRRVLMQVDLGALHEVLIKWYSSYAPNHKDYKWIHVDGKAIRGTVVEYDNSNQDFINIVSFYFHEGRQVLAQKEFHNHQQSEIKVVYKLIKETDLKRVIFTFDALHCKKKQ